MICNFFKCDEFVYVMNIYLSYSMVVISSSLLHNNLILK